MHVAVLRRISRLKLINISIAYIFCSDETSEKKKRLGAYEDESSAEITSPKASQKHDDELLRTFCKLIKKTKPQISLGTSKIFNDVDKNFWAVGLGKEKLGYNELKTHEAVRQASNIHELDNQAVMRILIEGMVNLEKVAKGSVSALWKYRENKSLQYWQLINQTLELFNDCHYECFYDGLFQVATQNLAWRLSGIPAKQFSPIDFFQGFVKQLCPCGIKAIAHDKDWNEFKKVNAFLTVARGSCELHVFLDSLYCGTLADRADNMSSSAPISAASMLNLSMKVEACIPLHENKSSGKAKCSQSINVRICVYDRCLAQIDAICCSQNVYNSRINIDKGACSSGAKTTLIGRCTDALFNTSAKIWPQNHRRAGITTKDRIWRMSLWKFFNRNPNEFPNYNVCNKGEAYGSLCLASAFLRELVECVDWIHFDISITGYLV